MSSFCLKSLGIEPFVTLNISEKKYISIHKRLWLAKLTETKTADSRNPSRHTVRSVSCPVACMSFLFFALRKILQFLSLYLHIYSTSLLQHDHSQHTALLTITKTVFRSSFYSILGFKTAINYIYFRRTDFGHDHCNTWSTHFNTSTQISRAVQMKRMRVMLLCPYVTIMHLFKLKNSKQIIPCSSVLFLPNIISF